MRTLLLSFVVALVASGCTSVRHHVLYEGDPAQKSQIHSYDTVLIKYIDDQDMGMSFIGQEQIYDIQAGQHVLLVEYSDLFALDADRHEKVVSRPAKVSFTAEAGKRYQVRHPPQKQLQDAKAFADKPEFWVVELPSGDLVASQMELSRPRSFVPRLKLANTPEYEFASDAVNHPAPPVTGSGDQPHLKMLQYTWKNASEQERAAFLEWLGRP